MEKDRESFVAHFEGVSHRRMALPKPIRLLAGACMLLFLFLTFQFVRSPPSIGAPGSSSKDSVESFVRDPNLDGKTSSQLDQRRSLMLQRDGRAT